MKVRADLNISLDGYGTTTDGTPEEPLGKDWYRLVNAYTATRTFRTRVLGDTTGKGTTGVDDKYAATYFDIGAEIMGARMFGLDLHPNEPEWHGWWGPNPPFQVPVFVLTHEKRPPLAMEGGTTFHFVSATPEEALALAAAEAAGSDVRIGGGPTVVRDFLKAGLVDELHVAIAPILLGGGVRLWDELRGLESQYKVTTEAAESGTIHVTFSRAATDPDPATDQPWRPAGTTL
ncbi:dihydrofolate reductase [Murinocardiopsis flavida]|uniref:Dihydrofolate reductase n=1 Tax=Murinocardiopsis flavida TaxID=645275 RepID=A0A2P8DLP0_9ACTN|nr:dihydrofolate reductase family protein [Murinocardiopsis flavida]PSK98115.1 dihydrofolate reductase [Murinocardiopsis flavida]